MIASIAAADEGASAAIDRLPGAGTGKAGGLPSKRSRRGAEAADWDGFGALLEDDLEVVAYSRQLVLIAREVRIGSLIAVFIILILSNLYDITPSDNGAESGRRLDRGVDGRWTHTAAAAERGR